MASGIGSLNDDPYGAAGAEIVLLHHLSGRRGGEAVIGRELVGVLSVSGHGVGRYPQEAPGLSQGLAPKGHGY
jgi:hypothetical protein